MEMNKLFRVHRAPHRRRDVCVGRISQTVVSEARLLSYGSRHESRVQSHIRGQRVERVSDLTEPLFRHLATSGQQHVENAAGFHTKQR